MNSAGVRWEMMAAGEARIVPAPPGLAQFEALRRGVANRPQLE